VRIVGGRLAGRHLLSPGGRVRPTAELVRARWLDSLEADLAGAKVLELFAGSGALGLEAYSRGAGWVDFVERSPAALHALKGNVAALRTRAACRIFTRDAMEFVRGVEAGAYDLALADPPYNSSLAERLVHLWLERPFARILSVEHVAGARLPPGGRGFTLEGTGVTTYRIDDPDHPGGAPGASPPRRPGA